MAVVPNRTPLIQAPNSYIVDQGESCSYVTAQSKAIYDAGITFSHYSYSYLSVPMKVEKFTSKALTADVQGMYSSSLVKYSVTLKAVWKSRKTQLPMN